MISIELYSAKLPLQKMTTQSEHMPKCLVGIKFVIQYALYSPIFSPFHSILNGEQHTIYVQIFEGRKFRGLALFRIFAVLFSRITRFSG